MLEEQVLRLGLALRLAGIVDLRGQQNVTVAQIEILGGEIRRVSLFLTILAAVTAAGDKDRKADEGE